MEAPNSDKPKPARRPQINITATAEEAALFERVAKKRGMKVSAMLRSLAFDEARRLGVE